MPRIVLIVRVSVSFFFFQLMKEILLEKEIVAQEHIGVL